MSRKPRQNEQNQQTWQTQNQSERTVRIVALVLLVLALISLIVYGVYYFADRDPGKQAAQATAVPLVDQGFEPTAWVEIDVKDYGVITAELYGEVAPITVGNFLKLAGEGFYDGLTFHRIISGFMIQGGDPNGNGTGGSKENIKGEFSDNGVQNDIKHLRGVLSMARSSAYNSASSQFFIMHEDSPHLDGAYAAFGRVLTGMDVVDAICSKTPVQDRNGTVLKANQPVINSIRQIEKPVQ